MSVMSISNGNAETIDDHRKDNQPKLKDSVPDQEDGISCCGAAVHIIRFSIGTGILLMPCTLKKLGFILAGIVFLLSGIVYYQITHMLLHAEHEMCQRLKVKRLSYIELVSQILKSSPFPFNKCERQAKYFMFVYYCIPTSNSTYLIVMADAIQTLARLFLIEISTTLAITIVMIPLLIFCLFQKLLKILVPFSSVTNVCSVQMVAAIVAVSIVYRTESTRIQPIGDMTFLPKTIALYSQIFSCTSLILAVNNDMRRPEKLTSTFGALNVASFFIILFHYSFGLILYINYGDNVRDNILLNMPQENNLTHVINSLYSLALFVSYILCFSSRHDNIWYSTLKPKFQNKNYAFYAEYGVRIGYNLISYLLAVAVPNIVLVSALAGSLSFILEIALPSTLTLLLYKLKNQKMNFWVLFKNLSVIGICLVLSGLSLSECVLQIIALYSA